MGRKTAETLWQWAGNKQQLASSILRYVPKLAVVSEPTFFIEAFCGTANMSLTAVELGVASQVIVRDKAIGVSTLLRGLRDDAVSVVAKAQALAPQVWDLRAATERQTWFDKMRERYTAGALDAAETLLFYRATFGGIHRYGPDGHNVSSRVTKTSAGPDRLFPDDVVNLAYRAGRLTQGWHIDSGDGFLLTPDADLLRAISGFDARRCIVYIDPPFPGGGQGDYNGGPVPDWSLVEELAHRWWIAGAQVLVSYPIGPWKFRGRLNRITRIDGRSHEIVIEHLYVWPRLRTAA